MNILVFPFGSAGDVHPMVGLAHALKARGHTVTVVVSGYFTDLVTRVGLDCVEQGSRAEFLEVLSHPDIWSPTKGFGHIFRKGVAPALRPQYDLIAERAKAGPILVVNSCLGFGARIARERLQTPLVTVHLQPGVLWSEFESPLYGNMPGPWAPRWLKRFLFWIGERFIIDRTVGPALNGFRAELGLPPVHQTTRWWHSPDENICLFPEWYAARQPDWPTPLTLTSFPLWDESDVAETQPDLEQFLGDGSPPIVFAPGSANAHAADFFRAAVDACSRLNRRAILLTRFAEQLPKELPAGVKAFDYVPFSRVLPRSAALVHHGGIGTAAQAMWAGIPHLVMPLAHDQPDNAARLKRLGVGDSLPPAQFHGANVAERLARLLDSADVKARCGDVQQRFVGVQPFADACTAIELLARKRGLIM